MSPTRHKKAGLNKAQAGFFMNMVGTDSFELSTPAMSTQCSTPELRALYLFSDYSKVALVTGARNLSQLTHPNNRKSKWS